MMPPVGAHALADIAVLKIDAHNLASATLGHSDQLKTGDVVLAIGNPFGVGLSVGARQRERVRRDGALMDSAGRVAGINTAILSNTVGFAGVGLAIRINLVRRRGQADRQHRAGPSRFPGGCAPGSHARVGSPIQHLAWPSRRSPPGKGRLARVCREGRARFVVIDER